MRHFLVLLGRVCMSSIFLYGAYWHITNWEIALKKTIATGVLYPDWALIIATAFMIIGGISLLIGLFTRIGAILLLIEVLFSALIFHPFWLFKNAQMEITLLFFLTKIALAGGLLFLLAGNPGKISLERRN